MSLIACNRESAEETNSDNQIGQSSEGPGTPDDSSTTGVNTIYDPFPEEARITAKEVYVLIQSEDPPVILDMRDYSVYSDLSIAEATSLPRRQMISRIHEIPREKVVVLIFESPQSANEAWAKLMELGFDPSLICIMDDNLKGWINAGYGIAESLEAGC